MSRRDDDYDDDWGVVPGHPPVPIIEIVIFVAVCIGLLAGAVVTVCSFLVALAGVL